MNLLNKLYNSEDSVILTFSIKDGDILPVVGSSFSLDKVSYIVVYTEMFFNFDSPYENNKTITVTAERAF